MIFVLSGILSALAYSSDSIFGKIALEGMPLNLYFIFVSFIYTIIGLCLLFYHKNELVTFVKNKNNNRTIIYAIIAVVIGTILGDYLMFYTINASSERNLPIALTLIHIAPIFSIVLVYLKYKQRLSIGSIIGILITFIGVMVTIFYSDVKLI